MTVIGYDSIGPESATGNWGLVLLIGTSVLMTEDVDLGSGYCYCAWEATFQNPDGLIQLLVYEIGVDDANSPLVAESNVLTLDSTDTALTWREFTFPITVLESGKDYSVCALTNVGQFLQQPVIMTYFNDSNSVRNWDLAGAPAGTLPDAPNSLDGMGGSGNTQISVYAEYTEIVSTTTTDTLTITSDARIVDPNVFTFAEPTEVSDTITRNYNTFDIKLKHTCTHYVSNIQYTLGKCPRCLGTGYYYDAKFNEMGRLVEISLEDKLQQALEKLVLTDENKFHTDVAIGLKKWLGEAPISKIKAIIKYDLVKSIAVLQETQRGVLNLSGRAQIASVDNIEVYENLTSPDTLEYLIEVTTMSGDKKKLTGTVIISGQ